MGVALKAKSRMSGRFALTGIAAAALCLALPSAWALGLVRHHLDGDGILALAEQSLASTS